MPVRFPVLRRPVPSAVLLLVVLISLSFAMDAHGTLGTDTGAKVYTLEVMDRAGTSSPVVGYWADEWDADGVAHPLFQAGRNDDGDWVGVTTLPMLEAARPLYAWGGYRLTLLLPMLGTVAAALVAGALARRLGSEEGDDGALAFWIIGLASPLLLYALDLWEHSLGVAAMAGGVLLLLGWLDDPPSWWRPLAAGALFGVASTLRTEALVYAVVSVGAVGLVQVSRRQVARAVTTGVAAVAGFLLPWFANAWLERSVGGLSRGERASGAVGDAASRAGDRVQQALVTTFGAKGDSLGSALIGLVVVGVVVLAVRAERRGDHRLAKAALGLAALPYVVGAVSGLAFIPGLFAAFPLAVLALVRRPAGPAAVVVAIAVTALPLVWTLSYVGGAGAQWGGRYVLTSMLLLGVVATLGLRQRHPVVGPGLLALTVGISVLSLVWLGVRSRSVDHLFADLRAADADVLIVRNGFLVREGGAASVDQRWLSVGSDTAFATAAEVAERSGASRVAVVEYGAEAPPASAIPEGWVEVGRTSSALAGTGIGIVVYELPEGP